MWNPVSLSDRSYRSVLVCVHELFMVKLYDKFCKVVFLRKQYWPLCIEWKVVGICSISATVESNYLVDIIEVRHKYNNVALAVDWLVGCQSGVFGRIAF